MAINFPVPAAVGETFFDGTKTWEATHVSPDEPRWVRQRDSSSSGMPLAGTTDQVLTKISDTDFDNEWATTTPGQPSGGTDGQALTKLSNSNYDSDWADLPLSLIPGGNTNDILSTVDGSNTNLLWKPDAGGLPSGTAFIFPQGSAPVGWITEPALNDRMMRVVNTTGGVSTIGGSHNPVFNDKAPLHTHTGSLQSAGSSHIHNSANDDGKFWYSVGGTAINGGFGPGGTKVAQTGPADSTHTHSVTVSANSSSSNWSPRYKNALVCVKS